MRLTTRFAAVLFLFCVGCGSTPPEQSAKNPAVNPTAKSAASATEERVVKAGAEGASSTAERPPAKITSQKLIVLAAASLADAVEEIAAEFAKTTEGQGVQIAVSSGASSAHALQIQQGAPADLFLSASVEWADKLSEKGLVAERFSLATNQLVVIAPKDSQITIEQPADLSELRIAKIAVAETKSVPAGKYAKRAMESWKLWSELEPRLVMGSDVREALAFVARQEAEAGFVYATDAASSSEVKVAFRVSVEDSGPIEYVAATVKDGSPEGAKFLAFLKTCPAQRILRAKGFGLLPELAKDCP